MKEQTEQSEQNSASEKAIDTRTPYSRYGGGYGSSSYYGYTAVQQERPLREYAAVLYQHRIAIMICIFLGVLSAMIVNHRAPRIYRATSVVNVGGYVPAVAGPMAEVLRQETYSAEYINSLIPLLQSLTLANRVLNTNEELRKIFDPAGVSEPIIRAANERAAKGDPSANALPELPIWLLQSYAGSTSAKYVDQTNMIQITATGTDPDLLPIIVNAHAAAFIEAVREQRKASASVNLKFLEARAAEAKKNLVDRQQAIIKFVQVNNFQTVDGQTPLDVNAERFRGLISNLGEVVQMKAGLDGEIRETRNAMGSARELRVSDSMQPTYMRLSELKKDYDLIRRQNGSHQYLSTLRTEMSVLERAIRKKNEADIVQKQIELKALEQREKLLNENLEELKKKEAREASLKLEYSMLKYEQDRAEKVKEEAKRRLEDALVNVENDQSTVTLVEKGHRPQSPISPDTRSNLIAGSFSGLVLGVSLAFLLDFLNNAVCSAAELGRVSLLPVLGVIPRFGRRRARKNGSRRDAKGAEAAEPSILKGGDPESGAHVTDTIGPDEAQRSEQIVRAGLSEDDLAEIENITSTWNIVCVSSPLSREAESFRNIRTTLRYSYKSGMPQIILVTSGRKGDGKTTVAANLAASLSRASARTLLIDADLRLPTVHSYFCQDRESIGLANYLTGSATLDEVLIPSGLKNLSLILAGERTTMPAELLETARMRAILELLRQDYEHIVIDTPPVAHVTDALLLSGLACGVLLVARSGKTPTPVVEFAVSRLRQLNARMLGCVLNDVRKGASYREAEYYYVTDNYYYSNLKP